MTVAPGRGLCFEAAQATDVGIEKALREAEIRMPVDQWEIQRSRHGRCDRSKEIELTLCQIIESIVQRMPEIGDKTRSWYFRRRQNSEIVGVPSRKLAAHLEKLAIEQPQRLRLRQTTWSSLAPRIGDPICLHPRVFQIFQRGEECDPCSRGLGQCVPRTVRRLPA